MCNVAPIAGETKVSLLDSYYHFRSSPCYHLSKLHSSLLLIMAHHGCYYYQQFTDGRVFHCWLACVNVAEGTLLINFHIGVYNIEWSISFDRSGSRYQLWSASAAFVSNGNIAAMVALSYNSCIFHSFLISWCCKKSWLEPPQMLIQLGISLHLHVDAFIFVAQLVFCCIRFYLWPMVT